MVSQDSRWRTPWPWIASFIAVALLGIGIATVMFAGWSDLTPANAENAKAIFADALAEAATAGPDASTPYLSIDDAGSVQVRRELEGQSSTDLRTLHLLAWDPHRGKLLRVDFPYWFVKVKMNNSVNLGTMTTALSGDWDNLDLTVSTRELRSRGAGIVLDHTRQDGVRLLLWNEAR